MKNFDTKVFSKRENLYLSSIFFLYGLSILSLAPRTPDIKANLSVNNGTFGTLLSAASVGSIIMLLIGGQIVNKIGAKRALQISSAVIATAFITLSHTSSPLLYLIVNVIAGGGISIYHVASTGHTLHRQDEVGKVILPKLHGAFAIGATSTTAIAFFISEYVSIAWHITVLIIFVYLSTNFSIHKLSSTFSSNITEPVKSDASFFKQLKFKVNWFLSLGFFCGQIIEFIVTDWATLFGKEVLGMGASIATLCYMLYLIGVIIGRFSIGWALNHQSEQFWIKFGGVVGGAGFIGMLILSVLLVEINQPIAYFLALLGFFLSGLGSAAMAPIFFSIAGRVLEGNNLMAVAQLTFINTILIFLAKTVLAWVAEVTSITVSLSISGLVMCALFYFGKIGSKVRI